MKSQRLFDLIMTVNAKRRFTVRELAEEFGVSSRTILRDLQELSLMGVPLYSEVGPHGGYRILKERVLPPLAFSENEAAAIFFASQSLKFFDSLPFETEIDSVLRKFYHHLPDDSKAKIDRMKTRIVFWNPERKQHHDFINHLLEASINQHVVEIKYESVSGMNERDIQPIGLYTYNGYWFCYAYCFLRENYRLFRADRIKNVTLSNREPIELNLKSVFDWLDTAFPEDVNDCLPLIVRLTREGVRRCKSEMWLSKYVKCNAEGEGTIETVMPRRKIEYCAEIMWNLGVNAAVEEPVEVVELLRDWTLQMFDKYGRTRNDNLEF